MSSTTAEIPPDFPGSPPPIPKLFLVLLALLCVVMGLRIDHRTGSLKTGKSRYLVEDAGISVVFAKNIAAGEGIVYYPDGEVVEGYSNPLWTFLMAALIRVGADPWAIPRPLGLGFTALGLFFAGLLFWWCATGPFRWLGLLIPPVAGEAGTVVIWSIAGLENGLYAAVLMAALAFFARERGDGKTLPISGFLFFLVAVTRPEGMIPGFLAGLFLAATLLASRRKPTKNHWVFAASFLIPLGLFFLWRYLYFAWPFPMPYYGKTAARNVLGLWDLKSKGWRYIFEFLRVYHYYPVLALAPLAVLSKEKWRSAALLPPLLAFTFFFPIYSRGDWMREWRFTSIITLLMLVMALIAATRLAGFASRLARPAFQKNGHNPGLIEAAATALAVLIFGAAVYGHFGPSQSRVAKFVKKPIVNTFKLAKRGAYFREMGDRLDRRPGSVLEVDMGGIGAASGMIIYDVGKLCDVPFGINQWNREFVNDYVFHETKPDFMHVREGFGRGSTILRNPKLRDYVLLPQDRRLGWKRPNGNYVRKELIVATAVEVYDNPAMDFDAGVSLVQGRVYPAVASPGQVLRFRLHWRARERLPTDLEMLYELVGKDGPPLVWEKRAAVMGWYKTSRWKVGEFPIDLVKLPLPEGTREGVYRLFVSVIDPAGGQGQRLLSPLSVRVEAREAAMEIRSLAEKADETFQEDPDTAEAALDALWIYRKNEEETTLYRRLEKDLAAALLKSAKARLQAGDETLAADMAVRSRRRDHRNSEIISFCKNLAKLSYSRGRALQSRGTDADLDAAYGEYREALRRYPRYAWARRRAEETRPSGVLRRGIRLVSGKFPKRK